MLAILIDAGATPVQAARATAVLTSGGTVREALDAIDQWEMRPDPVLATYTADLLLEQARRAAERVEVERS